MLATVAFAPASYPAQERDDRGHGLAADRAHRATVRDGGRGDADEIAGLLLGEHEAACVRRRSLERRLREVDDREARLRELRRDACERVPHEETDADDEVVAVPGGTREVRDVVARRLGDEHATFDAELLLRALEALVRKGVEPAVVEAPDVRDEGDADVRARLVGGTVLVTATAGDDARESDQNADCGKARSAHDAPLPPGPGRETPRAGR